MKLTIQYESGYVLDNYQYKAKRDVVKRALEDKYVGLGGGYGDYRDILRNHDYPADGVEFQLTINGELQTFDGTHDNPETAGLDLLNDSDPTIYMYSSTTTQPYESLMCNVDEDNFLICTGRGQTGYFNCQDNPYTGIGHLDGCQDKQIKVVYSDRTVATSPKPKKWKA